MDKIAVVDYGMGNTSSVLMAIHKVGGKAILTSNENLISESKKIILPGVGSYSSGMAELKKRKLDKSILKAVKNGSYLLGVCLGMQMLFQESHENKLTSGLRLIDGKVDKIPHLKKNKPIRKIPHIGWNRLLKKNNNWSKTILSGIDDKTFFYYVHSYMALPEDSLNVIATCDYLDLEIPSVVVKDNVCGIQFHPENSSEQGLKIYKNFFDLN